MSTVVEMNGMIRYGVAARGDRTKYTTHFAVISPVSGLCEDTELPGFGFRLTLLYNLGRFPHSSVLNDEQSDLRCCFRTPQKYKKRVTIELDL